MKNKTNIRSKYQDYLRSQITLIIKIMSIPVVIVLLLASYFTGKAFGTFLGLHFYLRLFVLFTYFLLFIFTYSKYSKSKNVLIFYKFLQFSILIMMYGVFIYGIAKNLDPNIINNLKLTVIISIFIISVLAFGKPMGSLIVIITPLIASIVFYLIYINDSENFFNHFLVILLFTVPSSGLVFFIEKMRFKNFYNENLLEDKNEFLKKSNMELKELSKLKDDFLAIASHDLLSPLAAIIGIAELLISDIQTTEEQRENLLSSLLNSAKTQYAYVEDLLNVANMQSGKVNLNIKSNNLTGLLEQSINNLSFLARKKNIKIETQLEKDIYFKFDYIKIFQVINNLISNAVKFTPQNGLIKITCSKNDKNQIELHVIDNGIGIPENKIKDLFNVEYNYSRMGTTGEKGHGLGLTIVGKIVELHGGKVSVDSVQGVGTDFCIILTQKQ